jgi:hypothetical protein
LHGGGIANHHGAAYQATGMACAMLVCGFVNAYRYAELTRSEHANVQAQAFAFLRVSLVNILIIGIAIAIGLDQGKTALPGTEYLGTTADIVLLFLVFAAAVPAVASFASTRWRPKNWQEVTVPAHISFLCHRVGEFTMLMLGESVLTCVTLKAPADGIHERRFHVCAVASFAITTALMHAGYSAASFDAQSHVMRRSAIGGIVWINNTWAHSFTLIAVGVGLRLAMQKGLERNSFSESCLLSGSLAANFVLAELTEFLHTLDGRPGGVSTWTSLKDHVAKGKVNVLLESATTLAQVFVPWCAVHWAWSAYDEVLVCSGLTLFACAVQAYDPNAHELEGRFHEHGHEHHD